MTGNVRLDRILNDEKNFWRYLLLNTTSRLKVVGSDYSAELTSKIMQKPYVLVCVRACVCARERLWVCMCVCVSVRERVCVSVCESV